MSVATAVAGRFRSLALCAASPFIAAALLTPGATAQSLNWEGVAGGAVTPFAYLARPGGVTRPTIAFHLLNGGDVLSRHFQGSFTFGFGRRLEAGYTRASVTSSDDSRGRLFDRGFNTFHAKVNLLPEVAGKGAMPAVSGGVIWRWQNQHLEDGLGVATKNADVYVVATRSQPLGASVQLLLNAGVKLSNASLLGLAGNAPDWQPLVFGTAGATFGGVLTLAAEYLQQPGEIDGLPGAELPATLAGFARIRPGGSTVGLDLGLLRLAGDIMTGFETAAERCVLVGVSYSF